VDLLRLEESKGEMEKKAGGVNNEFKMTSAHTHADLRRGSTKDKEEMPKNDIVPLECR
jgi:hypothetical protein